MRNIIMVPSSAAAHDAQIFYSNYGTNPNLSHMMCFLGRLFLGKIFKLRFFPMVWDTFLPKVKVKMIVQQLKFTSALTTNQYDIIDCVTCLYVI